MSSIAACFTLPSGLSLPNRIVKSAMTEGLATRGGEPSGPLLTLYRRWAKSGAGVLVTGNVGIDGAHPVRPRDVILHEDSPEDAFRAWASTCKAHGARVIMQLNHAGRQTPRTVNPSPMAPSEGAALRIMRSFGEPRSASLADIDDVVRRHGRAAAFAERTGFDGVQIHAAHGYLLNQFLAPDVNRRSDAYGGAIEARARLLLECVRAARAATGSHFTIAVKLNAGDFLRGGLTEDDALRVVALLDEERIDLLEISGGRYESAASFGRATPDAGAREAYFATFAARARATTRTPILLTGGFRSATAMNLSVAAGEIDLVGLARPMAVVPDYPRRLLAGENVPEVRARPLGLRAAARFEPAAELAWYYAQLARLGAGRDPDPRLSAWRALIAFVVGDAWKARRRRVGAPHVARAALARASSSA